MREQKKKKAKADPLIEFLVAIDKEEPSLSAFRQRMSGMVENSAGGETKMPK